jgi:FKBP-type peptidyl-prolyl cis-trans isomerase FkpA
MRTYLIVIVAAAIAMVSCSKSEQCPYSPPTSVASAAEVANLKLWLDTNSLPYQEHPSGIFYQVISPGSGATANVCSNVTVKYLGRLTTGAPFDSSYKKYPNGITFALGQLIAGWQHGIPLVKVGGSIILYIPPSLGYGSSGNGPLVPPNSNLVFNIDLVDVQ